MHINKKITTIICLLSVVIFSAMTAKDPDHPQPKNLKVLPKNISHQMLHDVMNDWAHALGVKCNFCHAKGDDGKMDFASDAKPEKEMARDMFRMAAKINKKYFKGKKDTSGMVVGDIKCVTCHRGDPHPEDVKNIGNDMHDMHMPPPGNKGDMVPVPAPPDNKQ